MARELLNKPDGFLFATNGEDEYIVDYIKRNSTVANQDDCVMHWILDLRKCGRGNIKKLYDYMYKDATIYGERKFKKFNEILCALDEKSSSETELIAGNPLEL